MQTGAAAGQTHRISGLIWMSFLASVVRVRWNTCLRQVTGNYALVREEELLHITFMS